MTRMRDVSAPAVESTPNELRPVNVGNCTLFVSPDGERWVKYLDMAERAEVRTPRAQRSLLQKAIKDEAIVLTAAEHMSAPRYRVVSEVVRTANGAVKTVDTYYLNEDAALLVLYRLGTDRAAIVAGMVIRAFLVLNDPDLFLRDVLQRRIAELERRIRVERNFNRAMDVLVARHSTGLSDATHIN